MTFPGRRWNAGTRKKSIEICALTCLEIKAVLTEVWSVVEHAVDFAARQKIATVQTLAWARAMKWRAHSGQKSRFTFWISAKDASWIHVSQTFPLSEFTVAALYFSGAPAFGLEHF